ncbi:MAG: hypothetical protein ACJ762_00395 [Solirubrobacteraceae bacterium]
MSDEKRMMIALPLFLVGALLAALVGAAAGAVPMILGLAALLWGRKVGDNRSQRRD